MRKQRMSFDQNYELRLKLIELYGESKTLDVAGTTVATRLTKDLGFHIPETAIYKACKNLGIKPRKAASSKSSTRYANLEARVATLEKLVNFLLTEPGAND